MKCKASNVARRRLSLEPLESRLCLSLDVGFEQGVLTIEGSPEADSILVQTSRRGVTTVVDQNSGQRWQFPGVIETVVNTGEGNDLLHVQDPGGDVKNHIGAAGGNDSIWIDIGAPVQQQLRQEAALTEVDLGEGDDRLNVNFRGIQNLNLDITAGDGDDNVLIGLLLPAVQKVREAAARVNVDLGEGNNRLSANVAGFNDAVFDLTSGDGDDNALIGLLLPAVQKVRQAAARVNADLGDGQDRVQSNVTGFHNVDLGITSGGGDDNVLIGLLLPAVQKVREAAARVNVDLGDGHDRMQSNVTGYNHFDLDITAGGGDDNVLIGLLLPAVQKVRESAARIDVDLGEGNNSLRIDATGMQKVDVDVTGGGGDDNVLIGLLLPAVQKVRGSLARVTADLGAGANKLVVRTRGFETVETP